MITKRLTLAHPFFENEGSDLVSQWFCTAEYSEGSFSKYWNCTEIISPPTKTAMEYTKAELLSFFPDDLDTIFHEMKVLDDANHYTNGGDESFDVNDLPDQ